jgi:hypothetical protein
VKTVAPADVKSGQIFIGGPASIPLKGFADWQQCPAEPSGLRELAFVYDDEKDYIARAMELEFRALAGGTSVYAHPVLVSVLVDDKGVTQGIRIITDDRAKDRDRRGAVTLGENFRGQYKDWNLDCQDIPMQEGEQKVGGVFTHWRCTGVNPDGSGQRVMFESSYLRKKGQEAISRDTQQVNNGYYQSQTRLELVNPPYLPSEAPCACNRPSGMKLLVRLAPVKVSSELAARLNRLADRFAPANTARRRSAP